MQFYSAKELFVIVYQNYCYKECRVPSQINKEQSWACPVLAQGKNNILDQNYYN